MSGRDSGILRREAVMCAAERTTKPKKDGISVRQISMGLSVVDLFSGAGGISEGFRQAGFAVIGGSDNDPDAAATYGLNFREATSITGDMRTPVIKERILEVARTASILVGGPPCQAFSQMRNHTRLIDDPRNTLYREFVDVLR